MITATYSPDDNKLRIYTSGRLPQDDVDRMKAAGFRWAPKQSLWVAPAWTPEREDVARQLAGEIGDEDTSLLDRAEERAERFEQYSDNREREAEAAAARVDEIAGGIPLGQPILIGHHSERHARKDAEKIERGMRRAVDAWKTARYWTERAAGAIHHAKYKELPAVRARRIKTIEADLRKVQRSEAEARKSLENWAKVGDSLTMALEVSNYEHGSWCFPLAKYPRELPRSQYEGPMGLWSALGGSEGESHAIITPAQAAELANRANARTLARCARWIEHLTNRLAYERAMLGESGGLAADRFDIKPGGQVLRRGKWLVVLKVNRESVSVAGNFARTVGRDEITDYKPPTEEAAAAVAKVTKLAPLCNYPGEGFRHMTRAELEASPGRNWSDFPKIKRVNPTEKHGAHRVHVCRDRSSAYAMSCVYITDEKRKDPPPASAPVVLKADPPEVPRGYLPPKPEAAGIFDAMESTLRAGVQVVSAPQLFPTPPDVAARMVELAEIEETHRVLEPSAGTGNLLQAIGPKPDKVAVEINPDLVSALIRGGAPSGTQMVQGDFLAQNGNLGTFDRVVMNPPFERGSDIKHIRHALGMLRPGGRLVAICANGPRQQAELMPDADAWIELESGTFAGTGVRAAIAVFTR